MSFKEFQRGMQFLHLFVAVLHGDSSISAAAALAFPPVIYNDVKFRVEEKAGRNKKLCEQK